LLLIESISHFYQIKFVSDGEREKKIQSLLFLPLNYSQNFFSRWRNILSLNIDFSSAIIHESRWL
jgi:hypothetical protein